MRNYWDCSPSVRAGAGGLAAIAAAATLAGFFPNTGQALTDKGSSAAQDSSSFDIGANQDWRIRMQRGLAGRDYHLSNSGPDLTRLSLVSVSAPSVADPGDIVRLKELPRTQAVDIAPNGSATVSWTVEGRNEDQAQIVVTVTGPATGASFGDAKNILTNQ